MTKNLGSAKRWELCAVLVSVLVSAPVVAWAGDPKKPEHTGTKEASGGTEQPLKGCPHESEKVELTIRQIDAQTYEVTTSRPDVPLYCGLGKNARVVPAFKEGESRGLKLFAIRPGSVYEQAGLRNGDVVRSLGSHQGLAC